MNAHDRNDSDDPEAHAQRVAVEQTYLLLGMLAAGANHEISSPIHRIGHTLLRIEGAIAKLDIPSERRQAIASELVNARRDVQRIEILSRALRSIVQPSEGATRIRVAIDEAITLASPITADRAQLEVSIRGEPSALADRASVVTVLVHLISNAAQAIAAGDPEHNRITIATHTSERNAVIEVSDTGHGIPDALCARIFDPHFSTRSTRTNSGMGLAIVLGIVRAHGGTIAVSPHELRGSLFRVTLPAPTLSSTPKR